MVTVTGLLYAAGEPGDSANALRVGVLIAGALYAVSFWVPVWSAVAARRQGVAMALDGAFILAWLATTGAYASPFYVLLYVAAAGYLPRPAALGYAAAYILLLAAMGDLWPNLWGTATRAGLLVLLAGVGVLRSPSGWRANQSGAASVTKSVNQPGSMRVGAASMPEAIGALAAEGSETGVAHVLVAAAARRARAHAAALHLAPADDLRTGLAPLRCAAAHGLEPGAEQALAQLFWARRDMGLEGMRLDLPATHSERPEALEGLGHIMAIPLQQGGQLVGVLSLAARQAPGQAARHDLQSLATVAAQAITRVRTRRVLEQQHAQFRRLSEAALEGVAIVDGGLIVEANQAFAALFGWSPANVAGAEIREFIDAIDRGELAKLLAEGSGQTKQLQGRRHDGTNVPIEVVARDYPYQSHRASVLAVRDLTDRLRAEAQQAAAEERAHEVERLREISRFRSNLLNAASHELKTPITPLKLQLHLLKSGRLGPLSSRQDRAVAILDRNLGRLARLVSDVLDVARLDSGRLVLRSQSLDLNPMIFDAVETFDETARDAGVSLDAHLHGAIWLTADPVRITQVLHNLISNALKFTPRGGRILVRSGLADGARGLDAWVRVDDTGIGLGPDQIARLFQPFSQVHDPMETNQPGTGLGLYISRGIVEQHGGGITCESGGRGLGTTFRFTLPNASPDPPKDQEDQRPSAPLSTAAKPPQEAQPPAPRAAKRPGWRDEPET